MQAWAIFAGAILCNILGNFFIKRFSAAVSIEGVLDYLSPGFIAGMCFFGAGLLLYARALKDIPISLAYPIMIGITMTALSLVAVLSFGERFGPRDAIGAVFVLVGVALLSRAA